MFLKNTLLDFIQDILDFNFDFGLGCGSAGQSFLVVCGLGLLSLEIDLGVVVKEW